MKNYKAANGKGLYSILAITVLYDIVFILIYYFIDSYELSNLLKITLIVFNIYEIYYILIYNTVNYSIDKDALYINSLFGLKRMKIPFNSINAYQKSSGNIKGVKLLGHGKNSFAIGKSFINKIGTTYMFVTFNSNIMYLNTDDINYGISPENFDDFEENIKQIGIKNISWNTSIKKNAPLIRNGKFICFFLVSAVLSIILALNPIIMYFQDKIPSRMPLTFNANFIPQKFGTGKQFAFKQMTYGLLSMAILFCMYYAGFLYGKYDKKSSYKFILVSLILSALLLVMQIRIILSFG